MAVIVPGYGSFDSVLMKISTLSPVFTLLIKYSDRLVLISNLLTSATVIAGAAWEARLPAETLTEVIYPSMGEVTVV